MRYTIFSVYGGLIYFGDSSIDRHKKNIILKMTGSSQYFSLRSSLVAFIELGGNMLHHIPDQYTQYDSYKFSKR